MFDAPLSFGQVICLIIVVGLVVEGIILALKGKS